MYGAGENSCIIQTLLGRSNSKCFESYTRRGPAYQSQLPVPLPSICLAVAGSLVIWCAARYWPGHQALLRTKKKYPHFAKPASRLMLAVSILAVQ